MESMEKKRKSPKASEKRKVGRPSKPEEAKHTKHMNFGVRDTHYQEFLELKDKWGVRDFAEAARRIWLKGLDRIKGEGETPPNP